MRSALVTGGSSGIGLAIARMLRDEGFELTLASRTREKIEAAAAELGAQAIAAEHGQGGGLRPGRRRASRALRRPGRARQLGGYRDRAARSSRCRRSTSTCSWASTSAACCSSPARRSRCCARPTGWIFNLASIAGTGPTPGLTVYGATKAAVIALTAPRTPSSTPTVYARSRSARVSSTRRWRNGRASTAEEMIKPDDCAEIVRMCLRLSPRARIPQVIVERVGGATASAEHARY